MEGDQREPQQYLLELHHMRLITSSPIDQENNRRLDSHSEPLQSGGLHIGRYASRQNADTPH